MRLGKIKYFIRGSAFVEYFKNLAAKRVVYTCSQLAVGKSPRASLSELYVGAFVQYSVYEKVFYIPDTSVGAFAEPEIPDDIPAPSDEQPKPTEYNKMDIDFETLIANEADSEIKAMHEYFSSRTPTAKNEYTGMFEGKNLILLTLEGFTNKCIDPVLTPTLYKMASEGFIFENFYNSLWGGSTASGEYAVTSGNFYTAATALKLAGDKSWPFALGNQFSKLGYLTKSYHNHTYTYYGRNLAHAAYGYDYKGIGNGLEGLTECWPESDLEMMDITGPEFVSSGQPFHIYYMTVSGHCEYSFNDNMMCYKNRELVKDMQASDSVRAYYACQIELDRALKSLVDQLDAAGKPRLCNVRRPLSLCAGRRGACRAVRTGGRGYTQ